MDSEDLLYLLYTSGTTAKPKGIMHTTGGYLTQVAFTHKYVFDLHPDTDIYWCAADIGWVTGHSYIVYGPLTNGATSVIYEGTPDTPGRDRLWDIAERYGVTILYTAPTAIRTFMKWGTQEPEKHDLSKLRLLGSVGEPINPEAWMWYHEHIGGGRCPIVDTWWQTETGAIMISPLPGRHHAQARLGHVPAAGHRRRGRRRRGQPRSSAAAATSRSPGRGRRCCAASTATPSATRRRTGRSFEGRYFAGDGCKLDDDGYLWLLGRVDDVMNVSGHRISTTEVESRARRPPRRWPRPPWSAPTTPSPARRSWPTSSSRAAPTRPAPSSARRCASTWPRSSAPIARPKTVIFTDELPKTRSGKIMRRLLRDVAEGRVARRHHHARRPGRGRGDQAPGGRVTHRGVSTATPTTGTGATGRSSPGPAVVFDMDGVLSDAAGRQHLPRAAAARLGRVLRRRAARTRSSTEVARLLERARPRPRASCC